LNTHLRFGALPLACLALAFTLSHCAREAPRAPEATPVKSAAPAYQIVDIDRPGTVTGTVRYTGSLSDTPVTVDRDHATCAGAGQGPSGAVVVSDGKVQGAVIEVVGVRQGRGFEPTTVRIDNVGCVFVPRVALARVGDTFVSHNSDPVFHNAKLDQIRGDRSKRIANLPVPLQGSDSPGRRLKRPGVVKVSCDAHLWMRSTVYVTDHPYTALTGPDGRFVIDGLPPGSYELKVWHEVLEHTTVPVTITAGASATADITL
jgi:plastocyanin